MKNLNITVKIIMLVMFNEITGISLHDAVQLPKESSDQFGILLWINLRTINIFIKDIMVEPLAALNLNAGPVIFSIVNSWYRVTMILQIQMIAGKRK